MDHIDCVYYINLDRRTDRCVEIESEIDKLEVPNEKRVRISGVDMPGMGMLGCGLAHKYTVERFLASPHKNCLILEDDFEVTIEKDYLDYILNNIFEGEIPFDCLMLGGNILKREETDYPFLHKVLEGQTTSAYVITRDLAPILLQNLEESTHLLEQYYRETGKRKDEYSLDQYWKRLQPISKWYIINPRAGRQRKSYSDIEEKVVDYGL